MPPETLVSGRYFAGRPLKDPNKSLKSFGHQTLARRRVGGAGSEGLKGTRSNAMTNRSTKAYSTSLAGNGQVCFSAGKQPVCSMYTPAPTG
jgi:hypothetical protein